MMSPSEQSKDNPLIRYIAPLVAFMLLSELQRAGSDTTIFWIYGLKISLVGVVLWFSFRKHLSEIQGKFDIRAVGLGLLVFVLWILPEFIIPRDPEAAFNPTYFDDVSMTALAITVRIAGAALVVPIVEELFFRSFIMRILVKGDFLSVPIGTYERMSFWITVAIYMIMHHVSDWPGALITGILYGAYLIKTKNLVGCMIAHGTTNLALGIYIVITQKWFYW